MAPPLRLDAPVTVLPGCGKTDAQRLARLGILTVGDLLLQLPFRLEKYVEGGDLSQLEPGTHVTVAGTVQSIFSNVSRYKKIELTQADVRAEGGQTLRVVWLHQPYVARNLRSGDRVLLAGPLSVSSYSGRREMLNPRYERVREGLPPRRIAPLMPVYHLTERLKPHQVRSWIDRALPLADGLDDQVPEHVRRRHGLLPIAEAVRQGHRPDTEEAWFQAKRRMTFADTLELQTAFIISRRRLAVEPASPAQYRQAVIERFKDCLGFELTRAQRRAAWEIFQDMEKPLPMNRLLDGDVGSGKTAVAAAAVAMAHAAGLQSVVMAPTEILARQHLARFRVYLEDAFGDLKVEMLISGLGAAERRRVKTAAASGHCALLVGTHALIEEEVELAALGLAVVDEQHRFGTRQREVLRAKSRAARPHFLCMSATPIPRSLAMALYGEMTLSVLDEMPPGRRPVHTQVVAPADRGRAYELVRREVRAGRQAYVICPLVEETKTSQAKAATAEFERLKNEVFPDLRLALVHGRMKDKDEVMGAFRAGESDVLVATSVIEVGVDVPNATVMLVEGADRFGLAQLHQFRGRVGRGAQQSYCLLLADDEPTEAAMRRLRLVEEVQDGFRLAEEDMNLRGMGELMGQRQHGLTDAAMDALRQPQLLSEIRQEAEDLAAEDPDFESWPALRRAAERRLEQTSVS